MEQKPRKPKVTPPFGPTSHRDHDGEVAVLLALDHLRRGFPSAAMDRETIEAYCQDLEDLDPQELMAACRQLRQTSKFFPSISEIRGLCSRPESPTYHRPYVPELPPGPETSENRAKVRALVDECMRRMRQMPGPKRREPGGLLSLRENRRWLDAWERRCVDGDGI